MKILILEDNPSDADQVEQELKKSGLIFSSKIVQTRKAFEDALKIFKPDLILSDYSLPKFNGIAAFHIKEKICPDIPFIIVSGTIGEEMAVELIKSGITDYALKDKLFALPQKLDRAIKDVEEKKEKEKTIQQREFDKNNLNALINNTNDMMWSVNRNFELITSNQPFDEMTKLVSGLVIPKGSNILLDAFPREQLTRYKKFYERGFSGETFTEIEYNNTPVDSWLEISFYPIRQGNDVIGTACHSSNITERKKSEEKAIKSEIQIRNFARHLNNVLEEERAHLAREIHDELGQQLAGIKMSLSILRQDRKEKIEINLIMKNVDSTIQSLRAIATELRPGILDSLGVIPSIQWLADEFQKKTKIKCTVELNVQEEQFSKNISICFFRICQEALTNISKHAEATKVKIRINQNKEKLSLEISDNGKGIASEKLENPFSMGLLGMNERAKLIGADLVITSKKGKGTTVKLQTRSN